MARLDPSKAAASRNKCGLFALAVIFTTSTIVPVAFAADYAPLDCGKAANPSEMAICRSYALGQAEARMATLFGVASALVAMGQRGDLGDAQKSWLQQREACGADVKCLAAAYRSRIGVLDRVIDSIAARGPF